MTTEELNLCFRTPSTGRPRPVFLVLIPEPQGKVSLRTEVPMHTLQRGLHTHNPVTCVCSGSEQWMGMFSGLSGQALLFGWRG